ESKRYAPWIDFRSFMDATFLNAHSGARAILRTADPRTRCGFVARGAEELFSGHDWPALASRLDMLAAPADARLVNMMRSFRPAQAFSGIEAPNDCTASQWRWLPWFAVLNRAQGLWLPDLSASTVNVPSLVALDPIGNP